MIFRNFVWLTVAAIAIWTFFVTESRSTQERHSRERTEQAAYRKAARTPRPLTALNMKSLLVRDLRFPTPEKKPRIPARAEFLWVSQKSEDVYVRYTGRESEVEWVTLHLPIEGPELDQAHLNTLREFLGFVFPDEPEALDHASGPFEKWGSFEIPTENGQLKIAHCGSYISVLCEDALGFVAIR